MALFSFCKPTDKKIKTKPAPAKKDKSTPVKKVLPSLTLTLINSFKKSCNASCDLCLVTLKQEVVAPAKGSAVKGLICVKLGLSYMSIGVK